MVQYYVGIDFSKYKVFFALLDDKSELISYKIVESPNKADIERGQEIYIGAINYFIELVKLFPDTNFIVTCENPIYINNIKTTLAIARNVHNVQIACFNSGNQYNYFGVDVMVWKKTVLGNGRATKEEINKFAKIRWPDDDFDCQDIADAACIGLYQYLLMRKI